MYLLFKKQQGFGCSIPFASCLGNLSSLFQQFSLDLALYSFKVSDSLYSGLPQCILHVVGSVSSLPYQIDVTAGLMTLLYIYFQIRLSVHLESKSKYCIKCQEPNFKSRSYICNLRFRQINFNYFSLCKFPIVSLISLSSIENLLELVTSLPLVFLFKIRMSFSSSSKSVIVSNILCHGIAAHFPVTSEILGLGLLQQQ